MVMKVVDLLLSSKHSCTEWIAASCAGHDHTLIASHASDPVCSGTTAKPNDSHDIDQVYYSLPFSQTYAYSLSGFASPTRAYYSITQHDSVLMTFFRLHLVHSCVRGIQHTDVERGTDTGLWCR